MPDTTQPPTADPGSGGPEQWAEPFTDAELADLLRLVDDPQDPLVVAGLAGTLYDPEGGDHGGQPA